MTDAQADRLLAKLDDIHRTLVAIAIAVQQSPAEREAYLRHHQRQRADDDRP